MPLVRFPWGSMSTRSTCLPARARPVARLMAVVVLPTPPFWLATARMRARGSGRADLADQEDLAFGVAETPDRSHANCPGFPGKGQFALGGAALEEQAGGARLHMPQGQLQQVGQGCQRA